MAGMELPPTSAVASKANKVLVTTFHPVPALAELPAVVYAVVSEWGYVFIEFRHAVTPAFVRGMLKDAGAEVRRVWDGDRAQARTFCMQGAFTEYGEWRERTRGRRLLSPVERDAVIGARLERAREARLLQRIARTAHKQARDATKLAIRAEARAARLERNRRREDALPHERFFMISVA